MSKKNNSEKRSSKTDKINLREIFENYYSHWKWLLLGVIIALALSLLYLKFATYRYDVAATILINDNDNGGSAYSELSVFQDLGLLGVPKTTLDTEMGILKSRTLMEKVIEDLDLQLSYYIEENFKAKEVYKSEIPLKVNFMPKESLANKLETSFSIVTTSNTRYMLSFDDGVTKQQGVLGERLSCKFGYITITPTDINSVKIGQEIIVKVTPLEDVAINYVIRLNITPENIKSKLLIISLEDPVRLKAQAIIDRLVFNYNQNAIEYKAQTAKSADEFIKNRINDISVELTSLDQGVETYKTDNKLSNMISETGIVLESSAKIENQIVELSSQLKLINYVSDYMKSNKNDLIPANLGMVDEITSKNMTNYNQLILERNRLSAGANSANPVIVNLNDQITRLRESIAQSLVNYRSSIEISLSGARRQEGKLSSEIYQAPKEEREIKDIQRQQQIFETLYLYLLQKREENSISLAGAEPIAKIIDTAYGIDRPVSPKKSIVVIVASLLGLLIPIFIIQMKALLNNNVKTSEDAENVVGASLLGEIPVTNSSKKLAISEHENSNIAESFRLVRTNINYLQNATKANTNTIFITSTIIGEGKTFIAINLATSFALLNKKVLLIGADIRKPRIATYLGLKQDIGLSHFLTDESLQLKDIIIHQKEARLDVLDAGNIPLNPSELLTNGRFEEVIAYGKKHYDYVVVDTSPVNVVTDTLLIAEFADLFVYVVRANYLDKRLLKIPKKLYKNKRLPNMMLLLNHAETKTKGSKTGYTDTENKKALWKKKV